MKHIKKIMIIVAIVIILLIILLLVLRYVDKKYKEENFENQITIEVNNKINEVKNRNEFFAVRGCITKYLAYVARRRK